jgi:hypothetical protein
MKRTELRRSDGKARASVPAYVCTVCEKPFTPFNSMQQVCGLSCARKVPVIARKAEAAGDRAAREAMKTQPELIEEAQKAFNEFVRMRDAHQPCICCGKWHSGDALTGGDWDAGHYRSRGAAPELRFDERNCHRQLKRCNRRAWDVAAYRANLIERIGLAEVEALEGPHPARKYTKDELRELRDRYRVKARELKETT